MESTNPNTNKKCNLNGNAKNSDLKEFKPVLVTQNPVMEDLLKTVNQVARTNASVLITGESGTGKEVIAQLVHFNSKRKDKAFIAVNCGAIPRDIIESELFGHEKGAFTGAVSRKEGCFEMANNGTLFFDEIAEMSSNMQVKLLRAVEVSAFRRVGGSKEVTVDVRLIAATNKNLKTGMDDGLFREDLFYRLSVMELYIPPLRQRKDDIPLLAEYFLSLYLDKYEVPRKKLSDECLNMMMMYDWPGNVRELRNVMERLVIVCPDDEIQPQCLPSRISKYEKVVNVRGHIQIPLGTTIEEAEKSIITHTLASVDNNISEAARVLGVSRKTLHNKLNKFSEMS